MLIDGIDNGLHYSKLVEVWKFLGGLSERYDTRIFATTHGMECIRAAHIAFQEEEDYPFRLHGIEGHNGSTSSVTYDRET